MKQKLVLVEISNRVAVLTLNRPQSMNALIPEMRVELLEAIDIVDCDDEIRAVVITGAGESFCAGGDVNAMQQQAESGNRREIQELVSPLRNQIVLRLQRTKKPFIAAVNGACAGGGLGLSLACDIRVASENATFSCAFGRLGLHPEWGVSYFLPRLIGLQQAYELIWSASRFSAAEAQDMGLLLRVVKPGAALSEGINLAERIAAGPPVAIQLSKKAMRTSLNSSLEEALDFESFAQGVVLGGEDVREGLKAFQEKRNPEFTGR